ncbi:hypothetical protein [uncultured Gammaproteobacteria bacterium]|nr:hypothetical protein [uncultured Gammaproteobacteria bacterium]CAC9546087.1 hypothetical protein [uncultured Gammaproteobacteria bacterium]CAC9549425.1 hypothetical protein [uncultured Gammaproteobacteria bacterium]
MKNKKKCLKIITSESEMRIKSIDDTNVLYQILSEKKKEKRKKKKEKRKKEKGKDNENE